MEQHLTREALNNILQAEQIERLTISEMAALFRDDRGILKFAPDGVCQIDPRNGDRIIYNSARARRPHDNDPVNDFKVQETADESCVICQGKTTGVVDVAELSQGFTFINKNLYPALFPQQTAIDRPNSNENGVGGVMAYGFHFLQWSSSFHNKDWHNMPLADRIVVMNRLAALEKQLLIGVSAPAASSWGDRLDERRGFVSIIKNYGRLVGGSLQHGHQQIGFSNVMPRHFKDNWQFEHENGEPFSSYLLRENSTELLVRDYGPAVLVVPYFMRRPFDMILILRDTQKSYLHQLTQGEISAVSEGWHDAIRFMLWVMPQIGRETAYNVTINSGPGAGLYVEFLPYSQETGGFEHLGLWVCQGNPKDSAAQIKEFLSN